MAAWPTSCCSMRRWTLGRCWLRIQPVLPLPAGLPARAAALVALAQSCSDALPSSNLAHNLPHQRLILRLLQVAGLYSTYKAKNGGLGWAACNLACLLPWAVRAAT